jgi:drug/metabolite transporter (DMT)-like permease
MRTKIAVALGIVYVVWGSTYLAIAVADRTLPPLLMLAVRFAFAGGILYGWSAWRGDVAVARPGRREWTAAAIVGGLLLFVETGGVAWAEQRVASGLTALLIAAVPLFTALLDRTFFGVRLSLGAVAGIATGLLGVALLVGASARIDPVGATVILGGGFAWAVGSAYARVAPLPKAPFLSAAMQMLCGAALLAVTGAAMGEVGRVHPAAISAGSLAAFAFLVVFGSIVTFTAYGWLLRSGAPSVLVSTYAYVNPGVAVLLGWLLAGEAVGGRELAAGAIILASVGMLVLARAPKEAESRPRKPLASRILRRITPCAVLPWTARRSSAASSPSTTGTCWPMRSGAASSGRMQRTSSPGRSPSPGVASQRRRRRSSGSRGCTRLRPASWRTSDARSGGLLRSGRGCGRCRAPRNPIASS